MITPMAGRRKVEEAGGAGIGVDEHGPLDAAVMVSVPIADLVSVIHLSDTDLLRLHVAGDPDAFGMLFLRHKDRLWAVALRTAADPEDAADALQEAMVSAFRRASDFRGDSAVTTWLHRIVVNASSSGSRSCSWTCWATRSRTRRRCSAFPPGRSRAGARGAVSDCSHFFRICVLTLRMAGTSGGLLTSH
jgi:hypothetical protein